MLVQNQPVTSRHESEMVLSAIE